MRVVLAIVAALGLAVVMATASRADTAPIADSPDLPWTNPEHQSDLELLLSKIASQIAKKDVTIRCEGDTDWRKLVTERGRRPERRARLRRRRLQPRTGELRSLADFAELTGEKRLPAAEAVRGRADQADEVRRRLVQERDGLRAQGGQRRHEARAPGRC